MSYRANLKRQTELRRKRPEAHKAQVHELGNKEFIITGKVRTNKKEVKDIPPPQDPPQGEYLATEYVHNLQQQIYFLNAEIRFLKDRAGVEPDHDGPSVDAAIRRLRKAMAQYEEETKAKIAKRKEQIKKRQEEINNVNETAAMDILAEADNHEREELQTQEVAFIEKASPITLSQVQYEHSKAAADFIAEEEGRLKDNIDSLSAEREQYENDKMTIQEKIIQARDQRKALLEQIRQKAESRYNQDEQRDIVQILANEPEPPQPNMSISTINSKNSKLRMEIASIKASKKEAKEQLKTLLEKNAKLYADMNILKVKADRGRSIKVTMEQKFDDDLESKRKERIDVQKEIEQLKKQKSELREKIAETNSQVNQYFDQLYALKNETEILKNVTRFKRDEKEQTEKESEITKNEIEDLRSKIIEIRGDVDGLSHEIADAEEKLMQVRTLVERNKKDPRCVKLQPPKELSALLDNLTAVKKAID